MLGRRPLIVMALVISCTAVSARAQSNSDFLAGWGSCDNLKQACEGSSPDDIYTGANLGLMGGYPVLGTCYLHDSHYPPGTTYPYLCWNYVKLSYNSGQKGYDGDRGCVGDKSSSTEAASRAQAGEILKQLCLSGACCCPQVATKPCGINTNPVRLRDPITGSCCTFPNQCSAPSDWQTPGSADCH